MKLPAHECGLYLEHNAHRNVYEKLKDHIEDHELEKYFESPEAMERAISTDELWTLQWYPETPVGFYKIAAPTLEELLARAEKGE